MNTQELISKLKKAGVFVQGHFVFTSGLHSDTYIEKTVFASLLPELADRVAENIVETVSVDTAEIVVAPAVGAMILGHLVAKKLKVPFVFTENQGGLFTVRRGQAIHLSEQRVLVVEDVITTGGSVKGTIEAVRDHHGIVAGVRTVFNRSEVTADQIGVTDFTGLISLSLNMWKPNRCPLCSNAIPVDQQHGHGSS